ncbi:MAG TPA: PPC domain-containing DNA-binding protein [Chloroflexota bacterium]|nr:PPC domain-containing DNA-binding protein [Chloroflexota bacterium]
MQSRVINQQGRIWFLVLANGEDVMPALRRFAEEHGIEGATFTGLGAFEDSVVSWFNWETKEYEPVQAHGQAEVLSIVGSISLGLDGKQMVHAHAVLGRPNGSVVGGHILEAKVRPTLEVTLVESAEALKRKTDAETGLALLAL